MKLLVTGGAGYIGSVVSHMLIEAGHRVEVVDDLSTGFADALHPATPLHKLPVDEVGKVLTPAAGFDGVLHFAGKISVSESVTRPDLYWDVNVRGSLALLDAMRIAKTPRLIFSSTGSMYASNDRPLTEDDRIRPGNPYANTKFVIDSAIADMTGPHGFAAISLRYFNAAGAYHTADGRSYGERHDPETHLIPIALDVAAGRRPAFNLYGTDYPTPDGTTVRDYVHVADLATAHLAALESLDPSEANHRVFNLGNGNGYSTQQVIDAVVAVTGRQLLVHNSPRRPGDATAVVASSERARRDLGWIPESPDLLTIIDDAWRFHQAS